MPFNSYYTKKKKRNEYKPHRRTRFPVDHKTKKSTTLPLSYSCWETVDEMRAILANKIADTKTITA